ncbi:hypothetical protein J6590_029702 [Homalodisca vitripennis]|nr:hypothetical protein J6590_029702 [Homalodisca vitripennis]
MLYNFLLNDILGTLPRLPRVSDYTDQLYRRRVWKSGIESFPEKDSLTYPDYVESPEGGRGFGPDSGVTPCYS